LAAASGSTGPSLPVARRAARCTERSLSSAAQSPANVAATGASATDPSLADHNIRRAKPCLHGKLRLGQVHLKAGPFNSTVTW